jgi:fructose-bisphosphate aldolase, class II
MQPREAAHVIDMRVRAYDRADVQAMLAQNFQNPLDLIARIDHDRLARLRVAQNRAITLQHPHRNYFVNQLFAHARSITTLAVKGQSAIRTSSARPAVFGFICIRLTGGILTSVVKPCSPVSGLGAAIEPVRGREEDNDMHSLRDLLQEAQQAGKAIGHFNISDLVLLKAVFGAARERSVPVLVGLSEGEREFVGVRQIAAFVRSLREEFEYPIFLNADHTHSLAKAMEAAKAGFDSIVFDLSALPFEQNVQQTKQAVEALKSINPSLLVEGEIGDIGTGSEIHDQSPDLSKGLSTAEEATQFVERTGVDVLAPAVGNMHGMLRSMVRGETKKRLDIERIAAIKRAAQVFLTLHGGSGTDDEDLRKAIAAGINIVHINTELRVAWRRGLEQGFAKHPDEVVPYKILPSAVDAVKQVVRSRLQLFNDERRFAQGV